MREIWSKDGVFLRKRFKNEKDFEKAVAEVQDELFGPDRVYLEVKRKIGKRGRVRGIPDGYLIDLSATKARLFVVENEIVKHDPIRHIATQILQFSLSFDDDPRLVKDILYKALEQNPELKRRCEKYVRGNDDYRNLDFLIECIVYDGPFAVIILVDEVSEELETNLMEKFQFAVEVIELAKYENKAGESLYGFEPFLADVEIDETERKPGAKGRRTRDITTLDTIVVPAREDGFQKVFLGENRWYEIRIHGTMRPQIKFIAAYRVHPICAVTHVAPVKSIEPWGDTGKFVVNFAEPARKIKRIKLVGGRVKAPRSARYTSYKTLKKAKTVGELWALP